MPFPWEIVVSLGMQLLSMDRVLCNYCYSRNKSNGYSIELNNYTDSPWHSAVIGAILGWNTPALTIAIHTVGCGLVTSA